MCLSPFSKLTSNQEASRLGNSQEEENAIPNDIFILVRTTQTQRTKKTANTKR